MLATCSIATGHYLFQYLRVIFFGYLNVVAAEGQAWLSKILHVLNSLLQPSPNMGSNMVGPKKNFQNKGSQMAGKRYFEVEALQI